MLGAIGNLAFPVHDVSEQHRIRLASGFKSRLGPSLFAVVTIDWPHNLSQSTKQNFKPEGIET
jgi:hypothetical protein